MTTLTAPVASTTTSFERALLRTAATLDAYVTMRLTRRAGAEHRRASIAQHDAVASRAAAQARGAIGILPR